MQCSKCGSEITFRVVETGEAVALSRFDPDLEIGLYHVNGRFSAGLSCDCGKCENDASDDFEMINQSRGIKTERGKNDRH